MNLLQELLREKLSGAGRAGIRVFSGTTPDLEGATTLEISGLGGLNLDDVALVTVLFPDVTMADLARDEIKPNGPFKSFYRGGGRAVETFAYYPTMAVAGFFTRNSAGADPEGSYFTTGASLTLSDGVLNLSCNRGPHFLPNRPWRVIVQI